MCGRVLPFLPALTNKVVPVFPFWLQFDLATLVAVIPAVLMALYTVLTATVFRA